MPLPYFRLRKFNPFLFSIFDIFENKRYALPNTQREIKIIWTSQKAPLAKL